MLKENWRALKRIEQLCDNLIIIIAFFSAYYGRSSLLFWDDYFGFDIPFGGAQLAPLKDYLILLFVALISYNVLLSMSGAYNSMRLNNGWQLLRIGFFSSLIVFFLLSGVIFILKLDLSRSFLILFTLTVAFGVGLLRYLVLLLLRFWRARGKNFRSIIICGIGDQALRLMREIAARPELGIRVRSFADLRSASDIAPADLVAFKLSLGKLSGLAIPKRVIQGIEAIDSALSEYVVDEIIFTDVVEVMPLVRDMIAICAERGVRTTIAADIFSVGLIKSGISHFGGMPLIHFQTPPGDRWELALKRWIDIVCGSILLVLLLPLMALIAILIKLTSPGPVLYVQKRVGLNGRLFDLYKFRSMYQDADKMQKELLQYNEMSGPVFKMKHDPRVTKLGKILRKFSLDELPQLYNVIRGDMSLVGPRPPIPGEVSVYERSDRRRLSMRPGMTCIWQVSGRNKINSFDSWVKLDLEYIDNWSLALDLWIMLKTIPVVLIGAGAR
ncbi:MAG TPA: sugar transferase [Oligoflexia bacterium]|nr:sugar transferase [Oligoflexia bacterium]HMP27175.1 sugar transferase [Oligoflexia bacterium]